MTTHDNETDAERTARNGQLSKEDINRMYTAKLYSDIAQARADGRLNVMLGGEAPIDPGKEITAADVKKLYADRRYDTISQLRADHRLDHLFAPTTEGV
jgi:hypothetical protein